MKTLKKLQNLLSKKCLPLGISHNVTIVDDTIYIDYNSQEFVFHTEESAIRHLNILSFKAV